MCVLNSGGVIATVLTASPRSDAQPLTGQGWMI